MFCRECDTKTAGTASYVEDFCIVLSAKQASRIPDDLAVIGFDNISESKIIEPSLTTIDIPRKFMGEMAAKQLLTQIANPVSHTVKIEVSTRIVKRFSA